jgi:hypothetical protein
MMVRQAPGIRVAVSRVSSGVQEKSYSPVSRKEGASSRVDPVDTVAEFTLDPVEVEVAAEDSGAALRVHPERPVAPR